MVEEAAAAVAVNMATLIYRRYTLVPLLVAAITLAVLVVLARVEV